jgi:hypothetical protein
MFRLMFLTFFLRGTAEQNTICTKVLLFDYHSFLLILATIGNEFVLPRKQLVESLFDSNFKKLATN